nr:protein detoxification 27 [Quercus suber]
MASYSMFVITQASAGHLGNLELAGISIATNVIIGFDFGLLLGMASALETLCGQAFGAKKYYMLGQPPEVAELSGLVAMWMIPLHFSFAFQFPLQRFLQSQMKAGVIAWVSLLALVVHLIVSWLFVYKLKLGVVGTAATLNFSCLENWYYKVLVLMTGNLKNAEIAVDALSICMTINGWEMMIPLAFFAATGYGFLSKS